MKILDNGGKTVDRYTIILGGDMYAASSDPFHPMGIGMYCGSFAGGSTRHLGKTVKWENLPDPVKKYISYLKS